MNRPDRAGAPSEPSAPPRGGRTLLGALILLAVLAVSSGLALVYGGPAGRGDPGWSRAVALVAGVCAVSSLGGWFVARLGARDPALAVSASLGAIALRLVLPLLLLGWLSAATDAPGAAQNLRKAGAGGLLVVIYLSLLATDILLHIMWGPKGPVRPHPGE